MVGHKEWVIPEGYIPSGGLTGSPALESHETASILNAGDKPANVEIMIYFEDREPVGPHRLTIAPRRTRHVRLSDLTDPAIPHDTAYSSLIRADVPIVVQHTRLDSRNPNIALLSTMAFPVPD